MTVNPGASAKRRANPYCGPEALFVWDHDEDVIPPPDVHDGVPGPQLHRVDRFLSLAGHPLADVLGTRAAGAGQVCLGDEHRLEQLGATPAVEARRRQVHDPQLEARVVAQARGDLGVLEQLVQLLVPRQWLRPAIQRLERVGCRYVDRDWATLESEQAGELQLSSPAGVAIDLHWELFNDWRIRRAFRLPAAEALIASACVVDVAGVRVRTLDPVDMVLHVAVHACTSGGWRLLWLKDLVRLLGVTADPGSALVARARSWQVDLVLAAMAERADRVLGTDGAPFVQRGPRPRSRWLGLMAAIDSLTPVERATGAASLTRIVTNSTRQDARRSTIELLRRSADAAVQRAAAGGRNRG